MHFPGARWALLTTGLGPFFMRESHASHRLIFALAMKWLCDSARWGMLTMVRFEAWPKFRWTCATSSSKRRS